MAAPPRTCTSCWEFPGEPPAGRSRARGGSGRWPSTPIRGPVTSAPRPGSAPPPRPTRCSGTQAGGTPTPVGNPGRAPLDRGPFNISVAADLAGLHPQTLRIYERQGLTAPAPSAAATRRYSRRDIDRLQEICSLTADGLNLAGIRRVLELQEETRQLQAELARVRELAGDRSTAAERGRRQRPRQAPGE